MSNLKQAYENTLPEVKIQKISEDNFDQAFDCYKASFSDGHNRYSFARLFRFQSETFLVAVHRDTGQVVGVIIGITEVKKAWMTSLCVHADHRRRGCGTALIFQLGLTLLDLGYTHAYVTTEEPAIIYMNKKLGKTKKRTEKNFFLDGAKRHIIEIDLEKNKESILPRI